MNPQLSGVIARLLQRKKQAAIVKLAVGELIPFRAEQWHELAQGTALAQAALQIRVIRAELQCMTCFEKYHPENLETRCPRCGGAGAKILAGEEFYLEELEEQ